MPKRVIPYTTGEGMGQVKHEKMTRGDDSQYGVPLATAMERHS